MRKLLAILLIVGTICASAIAQEQGQRRVIIRRGGPSGPGRGEPPMPGGPGPDGNVFFLQSGSGPMDPGGMAGGMTGFAGPAKWWKNSDLVKKLEISDDQVQKLEKIFQDHRLQAIELRANLEKQEALLEPLIEADQPNESQVLAGIDKVAQARTSLEKSKAQMLLAIRRVLSVDQWKKLQDHPGIAPMLNSAMSGARTFILPAPPPEGTPGIPMPMPPR